MMARLSRAEKVSGRVKQLMHKILQEKADYRSTLYQPNQYNSASVKVKTPAAVQQFLVKSDRATGTGNDLENLALRMLAQANSFKDVDLDHCLYAIDTLFVQDQNTEAVIREFLSLLDLHWWSLLHTVLQPRHIVQVLFYISTIRNAPVTLLDYIEQYLENHVSELDIKELSLVCHSYFVSNRRLNSIELIDQIADRLVREQDTCSLELLSNFMKMLHHSGYSNVSYYMKLGDALATRPLRNLRSLTFSMHLLTLYSSVHVIHPALFKHISAGIEEWLKTIRKHDRLTKELTRIAWAMTSLQEPVPPAILTTLQDELHQNLQHYLSRVPEMVIEALTCLIINDVYNLNLISQVFSSNFLQFKQGIFINPIIFCIGLKVISFFRMSVFFRQTVGARFPATAYRNIREAEGTRFETPLTTSNSGNVH